MRFQIFFPLSQWHFIFSTPFSTLNTIVILNKPSRALYFLRTTKNSVTYYITVTWCSQISLWFYFYSLTYIRIHVSWYWSTPSTDEELYIFKKQKMHGPAYNYRRLFLIGLLCYQSAKFMSTHGIQTHALLVHMIRCSD